jgi:hypothetical protein
MQVFAVHFAVLEICVFSNLFLYDTMAKRTMYVTIPYTSGGD